MLGAGFAAGARTGVLLTIALAVEYLFVGLSLAATLACRTSQKVVAAAPVALAVLTVLGTVLGVVVFGGVPAVVLAGVLAFGAVAFMYLATEELLVEAHAEGETAIGSVGFFIGFLIYLVHVVRQSPRQHLHDPSWSCSGAALGLGEQDRQVAFGDDEASATASGNCR
jgi:ZIP family zinc transporter